MWGEGVLKICRAEYVRRCEATYTKINAGIHRMIYHVEVLQGDVPWLLQAVPVEPPFSLCSGPLVAVARLRR